MVSPTPESRIRKAETKVSTKVPENKEMSGTSNTPSSTSHDKVLTIREEDVEINCACTYTSKRKIR
jgi:hypothetical protein